MRKSLLLVLALVVAVDASIGWNVWRARSAAPDAEVTLDERELPMLGTDGDSTIVTLSLQTHHETTPAGDARAFQPVWIDQRRLEELGFDCSVQPMEPHAALFYQGALPRRAYLVLALDDEPFQRLADRWRALEATRGPADATMPGSPRPSASASDDRLARVSRLVKIDVGRDPAALRARYPDRHRFLVLPTVVSLQFTGDDASGPPGRLYGRAVQIFPPRVVVPSAWRPVFDGLAPSFAAGENKALVGPPRYEVTLRVDSSHRPFVHTAHRR